MIVTGDSSLWQNSGDLYVGNRGSGKLKIENGGRATAPSTTLARNTGITSQGTLDLNGTSGSRGALETGYVREGTGSLGGTITFNGGILRATGDQPDFIQNFEAGNVQLLSGGAVIDTQSHDVGVSTALQGAGGLAKQGAGTLTLSGASTYGGNTVVETGTLALAATGSIVASPEIVVHAGATLDVTAHAGPAGWTLAAPQTLSGGGTISGLVTIEGTLSPGLSSPGLGVGQLTGDNDAFWKGGGVYDWEIEALAGDPGAHWDHFLLTGTLNLDANPFVIQLTSLAALSEADALGKSWVIATAEGGITGPLDGLELVWDSSFFTDYTGLGSFNLSPSSSGTDLVLSYEATISSIPEPGSATALATLLISSLALHRRRKTRRQSGQ